MTIENEKAFQDDYPDSVSHGYGCGRSMTASLHVDYLRPMPLGTPLELCGWVKESRGRKTVVSVALSAGGQLCVRGEVAAAQVPERWMPQGAIR